MIRREGLGMCRNIIDKVRGIGYVQECLVMGRMRVSMLQGDISFAVLSLEGRLAVHPYTARPRCYAEDHPRHEVFEVFVQQVFSSRTQPLLKCSGGLPT